MFRPRLGHPQVHSKLKKKHWVEFMDTVPTEFYKRTVDIQEYTFGVPMYRPGICQRSD